MVVVVCRAILKLIFNKSVLSRRLSALYFSCFLFKFQNTFNMFTHKSDYPQRVNLEALRADKAVLKLILQKINYVKNNPTNDSYVSHLIAILPSFSQFALQRNFDDTNKFEAVVRDTETNLWTTDPLAVEAVFKDVLIPELKGLLMYGPLGENYDGDHPPWCGHEVMLLATSSSGPRSLPNLMNVCLVNALKDNSSEKLVGLYAHPHKRARDSA